MSEYWKRQVVPPQHIEYWDYQYVEVTKGSREGRVITWYVGDQYMFSARKVDQVGAYMVNGQMTKLEKMTADKFEMLWHLATHEYK